MSDPPASRIRLLVATVLIDDVNRDLAAAFETTFTHHEPIASAFAGHEDAFDALLVSLDTRMAESDISALPASIRAIATYSVGTDHIDLDAAASRGIAVFNTPGVLSDSVAENALFLMLGAARRATESIDLLRSRSWTGWTPTQLVGVQLSGRRLGIVGMGEIGTRIARRARALGMEILYCNRRPAPHAARLDARYYPTPAELAAASDVLLLVAPSTDETRGLIDARLLDAAKPGLIVVNVARGDLVDDAALIAALRDGRVRAAGLDVFAGEPRIHPDYFELPNVFMVPHIGSSTIEARRGMGRILIEALLEWAEGGSPMNRVS